MTWAVQCGECGTTVWPPHEAEGSAGRSEIAALRLALEHATDTGHRDVDVVPGCYYVGDGLRPEGFGEGVDPDEYVTPGRGKLVDDLNSAIRTLEQAADQLEDAETPTQTELEQDIQERRLRDWAGLLERKQRDRSNDERDADSTDRCPECDSEPGSTSFSLAPHQSVCSNRECPVVSWRSDRSSVAGDHDV